MAQFQSIALICASCYAPWRWRGAGLRSSEGKFASGMYRSGLDSRKPLRRRHSGAVTPAKLAPCPDTGAGAESSQIIYLLDAGRYGYPVLGFGILRRPAAYIHVGVSRHFLHPVGRFHRHDVNQKFLRSLSRSNSLQSFPTKSFSDCPS